MARKPAIPDQDDHDDAPAAVVGREDTLRADEPPAPAKNMIVELYSSIAFGGLVLRPKIDDSKRGRPPVIEAVRAVVPAAVADAYGAETLKKIGPAAADAKVGVVAQ